ncbi:hypothetical protein J26TS2_28730 [Shouchella clausii]|nr:hypothetical protein J26TS2_28730 [Shouchella clausii]
MLSALLLTACSQAEANQLEPKQLSELEQRYLQVSNSHSFVYDVSRFDPDATILSFKLQAYENSERSEEWTQEIYTMHAEEGEGLFSGWEEMIVTIDSPRLYEEVGEMAIYEAGFMLAEEGGSMESSQRMELPNLKDDPFTSIANTTLDFEKEGQNLVVFFNGEEVSSGPAGTEEGIAQIIEACEYVFVFRLEWE